MGCILRIGNNKIANKGVVRIFGCMFLLSAKFLGNRIRNIKSFRFRLLYGYLAGLRLLRNLFPYPLLNSSTTCFYR